MKPAIVALAVCVVVLGVLAYRQSISIREQQSQLEKLTARLASGSPTAGNLDVQEKCAEQAHAEFVEQKKMFGPVATADFEDHYSPSLNKCFVKIQFLGNKPPSTHVLLVDAFEGKLYAEYSWVNSENKKYWQVPPFDCKVVLASGEEQGCHSEEEFDQLLKRYMEK